ncbi:MAG: hypothetical protein JSU95_14185 [Betaproteobacteria bacterium]|nr:MAG: hypothetical protein JSU95_14185 [Betaproteobacteria bacterium]
MRRFNRALQGLLFVICLAMSGTAFSDNCSGTWTTVGNVADTHDLGNGVTLTAWSSLSSAYWNEIEEMVAGTCTGYTLTMADGTSRTVFACARRNSQGDVQVDEGSLEPGAERGTWKITTATGAFAKRMGNSGWWQGTIQDGKVGAGIWGGNCKR